MSEDLTCSLAEFLLAIDWLETIQAIAATAVSVMAAIALRTWRKEIKSQKQLEFTNEIIDITHQLILSLSAPISHIELAKIGINSYEGLTAEFEQYENPEMIAYIENRGAETSKRILGELNIAKPILGKLQTLATRGQILGIKSYSKCLAATNMLQWSHHQIEVFAVLIGSNHMNWGNPEVQASLSKLNEINPETIRNNLSEQSKEMLLFGKAIYEELLT